MPIAEENKIAESNELMMRQVHPNLMQEGRPWSGAFTPTSADKGLLSADRESVLSPKDAYERYLQTKSLTSAGGTWAVSVSEFNQMGLDCYTDAIAGNDAHALIDFSVKGEAQYKSLGKVAFSRAHDRGRVYP